MDAQILIRRHIRRGNFAANRPRPSFTPWPLWTRDVNGELLRPPPVTGQPGDLLTDLHKIADRARDDIRNEAQLIRKRGIYYADRVNGQLLAFAFAYIRPYGRTTEQITAVWLGLDQGMKEYNRPR